MYKNLFLSACVLAVLSNAPLQAAQIPLTTTGQSAAWIGLDDDNVLSIDEDDPVTTLATISPGQQIVAPPSSFAVTEQNFGGPPPTPGQSFLATKSGTVGTVQMLISGAGGTYNLHLYDLGANAPAPTGATSYTNALPDSLPADTWMRFFGSPGNSVAVLNFFGGGLSSVQLIKGHTYIWELVGLERDANGILAGNNTSATAMTWLRNGGNNSYLPNGQAFRSRTSLNGNPDRSFAMAVTLVPEPTTLVMVGLGAAIAIVRRRRQKSVKD